MDVEGKKWELYKKLQDSNFNSPWRFLGHEQETRHAKVLGSNSIGHNGKIFEWCLVCILCTSHHIFGRAAHVNGFKAGVWVLNE